MESTYIIDPSEVTVVYDIDDTLHGLVPCLTKKMGIELSRWESYYVSQNDFTPEEQAEMLAILADDRIWRETEFFPGAADILLPQRDFGISMIIKTKTTTETSGQIKVERVLEEVVGAKREQIICEKMEFNQPTSRELPPGTLILVDDSPHHVRDSNAQINVMPYWPWNQSAQAMDLMRGKTRIMFDHLVDINHYVYRRVEKYLTLGV